MPNKYKLVTNYLNWGTLFAFVTCRLKILLQQNLLQICKILISCEVICEMAEFLQWNFEQNYFNQIKR